jgi:hypothetical protein
MSSPYDNPAPIRTVTTPYFPHRLQRRCTRCGKVAYDEARATEVAALVSKREPMQAYFDPRCGHWHLTRGRKAKAARAYTREYGNW